MDLTSKIAALQDFREYEELNWSGTFEDYLEDRARESESHAHRVPARLRHGPVVRTGRVHRQQEEADPLQLLQGRAARRPRRRLRPRHSADEAGQRLQVGGAALRHREARHPAARPGRLVEVDDRAPAQEGARGVFAHARGRALHLRMAHAEGARAHHRRARGVPVADARRSAAPHSRRLARARVQRARARQRAVPDLHRGRSQSGVPADLPRADGCTTKATGRR